MAENKDPLTILECEIIECRKCPRLVEYREKVAREKRRAFREWEYWGRPVPGFGDPHAKLFILGLAPGAHGSNRTGRMFTGDRSGEFLYTALHVAGFANQATWQRPDDGLKLKNAFIAAAARCAPPDNKPLPSELLNCRGFLERELELLRPKVVLALGKIAWDTYLEILKTRAVIESRAKFVFAHGAEAKLPGSGPRLIGVYHPSQQNTQTGKLTAAMYAKVLKRVQRILQGDPARLG
jgi:uracil-DNA glycosylase family 4